uniref:GPS domain-containing protein n=1 Tax=Strigamia maritima TaxID=126957 RepID=T1IYH3_STRMM
MKPVCIISDSGVGKSSIVQRFVHDTFTMDAESTIGASFMTKTLLVDDVTFKFQIWDTAGQERYRALAPMYYRGAGAAIIVYDVTQETTYQSVKTWVKELAAHGPRHIVIAIAGNKCDLEERREVKKRDSITFAESINALFIETSAKTAINVHVLFSEICKRLHIDTTNHRQGQPRVLLNRSEIYLLIWFSFTISNWRTVQLDYDVPTTSTVKNTPSDLDGQFDSESNKNDFVIEKNKEIQRDFLNPTLDQRKQSKKRRPQKPSKYKASTIFGTSRKSFAFTPISGQSSTEKGNNKSPHNRNSSPSVLQVNASGSTTETPILKTVGIEHSTIKESANIAASVDQTIDSPETQTESKKNKSSKNILTTLVSATKNPETNTKTDTPLNGHLEIATPPVSNENAEYRSDEPRRKESEFIPDLATETSNNQQASNRLNPSQPRHETLETRKPDLHLLTPEPNAHNILITTDKNKETEILQGKNVKPNKDEVTLLKQLIQTTTSSHQKDTAINKINKRHVNPPEPTADDIEYTPFAAALSNDEVEEKYKTKSNVQPKSVRRKVLNDFGNDLRGLCADLSGTKDKGEVALADISLTTILTPFAGKSQNFFEICSLTNDSVTKIKNTFAIGRELEEKYKSWECDEKQPKCDGLCLGVTHLISHYVLDIFTNKRINRRQAYRSTIVNVLLINPKTWEIVKTEHLSTPVEYKLQLYSNEVEKDFELACCVWERNLWNKSACKTVQLHNDMIHCACYSLGYTTAFLIEKGVTNTDIPKEMTKQLTDLNKNKNKKSSLVKYKFEIDADYNKTVGNDKKATEERFKEQIAKQLNLTKESIERVIIAPECDDCDVANDSSVQNFTQKVRNLYPSAPGSIKVVVQVKVDAKSNVSAADVHKHLQDKINNNELVLTDKNKNKLEINPDQNVGVEIEAIEAEDNSLTTAIILCVVIIVLLFFLVILGVAINKKLKKGREKILPFNKKLTPYLNPTYKSFHNENTLDGTIESLVRIRRRSDQFLYDFDKAVWDSGKGAGMNSHVIKPSCPSWSSSNSALRRHSQPPSLSSTIGSKQSMERRIVSPPMPGYVDDNSV